MTDEAAEAWFEKHPECAQIIQTIEREAAETGMQECVFDLMQATFRQYYVQNLASKDIAEFAPDDYEWWTKELSWLKDFAIPKNCLLGDVIDPKIPKHIKSP